MLSLTSRPCMEACAVGVTRPTRSAAAAEPCSRAGPRLEPSSSRSYGRARRSLVARAMDPIAAPEIAAIAPKKILILGGTGRVGSSTAAALLQLTPGHAVTICGRAAASHAAAIERRPELAGTDFLAVDIYDHDAVKAAAAGFDLVIHTAGPFQRREDVSPLRACIAAGVPYIDVCDDQGHSELTKALHDDAVAAGVPCLTTAGIYPGISNVMAAHMCSLARKEYDAEDLSYRDAGAGEGTEPSRLLYSYYTAGTGGAGPTILETTFLLAGEPTVAYKNGKRFVLPPMTERRSIDFGPGLRRKDAWLFNLPEVKTGFEVLRVPSVSARFGTSPAIWNFGTWLVARLAPRGFLEDRAKVRRFVAFIDPVVRAVDRIAGEAVGMRVEVQLESGQEAVGLFVHKFLSETVGSSTAAFAEALLEGHTEPGVWYPEERGALTSGAARLRVMHRAAQGQSKPCFRFELNKASWQLETDPKYLVMGLYW